MSTFDAMEDLLPDNLVHSAEERRVYQGRSVRTGGTFPGGGIVYFGRDTGRFRPLVPFLVNKRPFPEELTFNDVGTDGDVCFLYVVNPEAPKEEQRVINVTMRSSNENRIYTDLAFAHVLSGETDIFNTLCVSDLVYELKVYYPAEMAAFVRRVPTRAENDEVKHLLTESMKQRLVDIWLTHDLDAPLVLCDVLYHPDMTMP